MTQTVFSMVFTASFCMPFFVFARVWRNPLGKACKTLRFCNSYENAAFCLCNMSANPFENGLILMKISEMR